MSRVFFEAIRSRDGDSVRELISADPSVVGARDEQGVSALLVALYHRSREIADLILASDPALDIFEAAATGRVDRLTELLRVDESRVNVISADGFTALHLACFFGQLDAADALLESGADTNAVAQNASQVQPLHSAAASRDHHLVELLLRRGASVNARQQGGWTALHTAAMHGDERMARLLLEHGADPRQAADDGKTPVDLARAQEANAVLPLLEGR